MDNTKPASTNNFLPSNSKADGEDVASDRESSVESFHTNKSELSGATESELIDIDDIELSDEESWLYKSPRKQINTQDRNLSTYNWLHKDVEHVDDLELLVAKKALVSKLDEIKILNPDLDASLRKIHTKEKQLTPLNRNCCSYSQTELDRSFKMHTKEKQPASAALNCDTFTKPVIDTKDSEHLTVYQPIPVSPSSDSSNTGLESTYKKLTRATTNSKVVENITDVHEIARLQEESLRQSTSKFFNQTESRKLQAGYLSPIDNIQGLKLTKPLSVEALYMYNGKQSPSSVLNTLSPSCIRKQSPFSSTLSLNQDHVSYRGSLPNINNGYSSLRQKKSKRPSDQKVQCPLPMYPSKQKLPAHELSAEALNESDKSKPNSLPYDYRETSTLPSSYRMNSRNSTSRRNSTTPSPRKESTPFLLSPQKMNSPRRDSAPCNGRKFMSPVGSPTQYRRNGSLAPGLLSPNRIMSVSSLESRSLSLDRQQHSLGRLPLTTSAMLNQSPRCGRRSASPFAGEMKGLRMPTKIPNPASRSGIPVPSSQYISRSNIADESWSDDFF